MTVVTLTDILPPANKSGCAILGAVCLGWEDMRAHVSAAEQLNSPIILQAGPGCRRHTPLAVLGPTLRYLAKQASVPVAIHLDHSKSLNECAEAISHGFTSVMYDGSDLPLHKNIENSRQIIDICRKNGVSFEGEVGLVGYSGGATSQGSEPAEVQQYAETTGADCVAISIGNVHLTTETYTLLNESLLGSIENLTDIPLVIHGGSGVSPGQRTHLSQHSNIAKFNIGTEIRQSFGSALHTHIKNMPQDFDRISILSSTEKQMLDTITTVIKQLNPNLK